MKRILITALALLALAMPFASAQIVGNSFLDCSQTSSAATGTVSLLLGGNAAHNAIQIQNVGAVNIGFSFQTSTPKVGVMQTYTLTPGSFWQSVASFVPLNPIYLVSTGASTPVSCSYH